MSRKSIKDYFNVTQLENHGPHHADDNPVKKMIQLKKINIENCFLVGLSAIYLLKAVLRLKYEKITVINNIQLLHYIDTVLLFVQDPYTDMYLL